MSDANPPAARPRRASLRPLAAFLALVALVVVGTIELRANRAAGAAVRAIEARMAGAGEGDGNPLPTRAEVERLIGRRAVGPPATAPDGSLAALYRWAGLFRSYEVRAYYSPGPVPRLARFEAGRPGVPAAR
jgi:hypothetical protein